MEAASFSNKAIALQSERHHIARESNLNQHHHENLQHAYGTHFLTAVHWYHHSTLNVIISITLTFQASTNQGMFVNIHLQDAHCNGYQTVE
jgi:hypothetical protein